MRLSRGWGPLRFLLVVAVLVLFMSPLLFMFLGSLRVPGLPPPEGFEFLPDPMRERNYLTVFEISEMTTFLRNSAVVVALAVPITVVVGSWAGFAIATASSVARRRMVAASLIALMIPLSALWVPRFVLFKWAGLTGNLGSLIAPALMATTPFYVLLFALSYARLPRSYFEVATLEGLSPLATWRTVAWPLTRPVAGAVAILAFVFHWSNLVDPLLYLSDAGTYTLPLGLRALQTFDPTNYPILLAASLIATVPPVVGFMVMQRAFFRHIVEVRG
ncbi:MAG TPA: carbohydrate ABC transporter permease [Actinomycetota bacterium]|nr:carbohydrate ABC transporter permease [Actinomycetota bacterium]